MYALVDCNNFYVSCERLFQPAIRNLPVVVLSNNDGCVIARSEEAKALGIVMGTPAYLNEESFKRNNVKVFSSNYTLYGDMSDRVMKTLAEFCPSIELYSIDEAFLDLSRFKYTDLGQLGSAIRTSVTKNTGIPVSVGIAPTKTLAKMANRYAKKKYPSRGVFLDASLESRKEMLAFTQVEDIWGIGRQYAVLLRQNGFSNALDILKISPDWMRKQMSVVGLRLWNELHGIPSFDWEGDATGKKNICTSRSFGSLTNDYSIIKEAVSNYAATCAMKLRQQNSICRAVNIFISTNPHKIAHAQYSHSLTIKCETATNLTSELIGYALKGLDLIFQPGKYLYMKCGVMALDIIPESAVQVNLFDGRSRSKDRRLAHIIDAVNNSMGKDTVKMAVQRFDKRYKLRAEFLSRRYTTDINQLLIVKN